MKTNLCIAHDPTFWPFRTWAELAVMPEKEERLVIIPVTSFSDWGLDTPLDFEETLMLSLLRECLGSPESEEVLVIPPLRFNLGRAGSTFFRVDPETAHGVIEDVARSIHASGFRKIVFLNSSQWNEPLVDAAGRDLRISLGLQPFCIFLSALGFDLTCDTGRENFRSVGNFLDTGNFDDETGKTAFIEASRRLGCLLKEIRAFRPLPEEGRVPRKAYPL